MKEIITKFDLEAAFKALEETEIPKVKGLRANRMDLSESTRRVDRTSILVEDYYDVNNSEDLNTAHEQREAEIAKAKLARIEKIVDLDAETEEDILPSYVGKHIIQCPQCMTLFYKDPEDIVHDEANPEVVNVNEICQHCGNDTGYSVIGKVAAEETPVEEIPAEEEIPMEDIPEEEAFEDEEPIDETSEGEEVADSEDDLDLNLEAEDIPEEGEEEATEEVEESLHNSEALEDAEENSELATEHASEHTTLNEETETETDLAEDVADDTKEKLQKDIAEIDEKIEYYANQIKLAKDETDRRDFYRKIDGFYKERATKQALIDGGLKMDDLKTEEVEIEEKATLEEADAETTPQNDAVDTGVQEPEKQEPDVTDEKEIDTKTTEPLTESKEAAEVAKVFIDVSGSLEARKADLVDKAVKDGYTENAINFFDSADFAEPIKAAEEGGKVVVYTNDDYKTNRPELAELKNVKIVAVTELTEEAEVKLEVTEAEIDKMFDSPEFKKPISETEVEGYLADDLGEDIELDAIEDLNDKSINECLTGYLTEVYSNVENFVTTDCEINEGKLIIEGTINFKSGKTKTTCFEFTKVGKNLLEGVNADLIEGAAFKLTYSGEDSGKMLLAESLHYSYTINGTDIKGIINNR